MGFTDFDRIDIDAIFEPPVLLLDSNVVSAHLALPHLPILCECPILQAVTAFPLHFIVRILVLIPELDGDLVILESEELLPQTVALLFLPLLRQELFDRSGADKEGTTVSPDGVRCVSFGYELRVPVEVSVR